MVQRPTWAEDLLGGDGRASAHGGVTVARWTECGTKLFESKPSDAIAAKGA